MKEIYCTISGRVQLVMFRDFVQRKARSLGLVGTVQNLDDGQVVVLAQGSEEKLETLIKYLRRGPVLAKVKQIQIKWLEPVNVFKDFRILLK